MKRRIRAFSLLLLALMLVMAIPFSAQAAQSWTAYGRTGHASASGNAVSFVGHPSDPFVTLLFSPASDGDYRTLTFHLSEGNSDWHTLEGSGFLYNADVSNGVINGDAVLFTASSVGLYKLANVSAASLASAHFTALPGVSLVESKSKPAYSSGTTWYLKLVMSPGSLKVEKHASPTFNGAAETLFNKTFAPSERSPYSGYVLVGLVIAVIGGTIIEKLHMEKYVEEYITSASSVDIEAANLTKRDRLQYAWEQMRDTFKKVFP